MDTWYISFASDQHFYGAVFITAKNCEDAERRCQKLKIRPDGAQFLGFEVSAELIGDVKPEMMGRLLTRKELESMLPHWGFVRYADAEDEGLGIDKDRVHIR